MEQEPIITEICRQEAIPAKLKIAPDSGIPRIIHQDGKIYLSLNRSAISLPDTPEGNELALDILMSREECDPPSERASVYFRILTDPEYLPDSVMLKKYQIDPSDVRTVVVFRSVSPSEKDLYDAFLSIAPVESSDRIVRINYRTIAFIQEKQFRTDEELKEYTQAVIGTMESEGINGIRAGIGCSCSHITGLFRSYREASEALETGVRFQDQDHVFCYAEQMLERIIDSIPEDKISECRKTLFSNGGSGNLNDEMSAGFW